MFKACYVAEALSSPSVLVPDPLLKRVFLKTCPEPASSSITTSVLQELSWHGLEVPERGIIQSTTSWLSLRLLVSLSPWDVVLITSS